MKTTKNLSQGSRDLKPMPIRRRRSIKSDIALIIYCITRTLIDAGKEVGLEVNTKKAKYMLLSRHKNSGQNHDIKIGNRRFENVAQFRYLGTTVTNQNLIQEEIKRTFNSGNAWYHSVQNILSSRLLYKNIKIRI
jgi:hypothetical protein